MHTKHINYRSIKGREEFSEINKSWLKGINKLRLKASKKKKERLNKAISFLSNIDRIVIRKDEGNLIICKEGKKCYGMAFYRLEEENGIYLDFLISSPEVIVKRTKKGVGTKILKSIMKKAILHNYDYINFVATSDSEKFYAKVGFDMSENASSKTNLDEIKNIVNKL